MTFAQKPMVRKETQDVLGDAVLGMYDQAYC